MNAIIKKFQEDLEKEQKILKEQEYIVKTLEKNLNDEICKETRILNEVLKNNLIVIIEMIHKRKLLCSSVFNAETMWHDTTYKISDGNYYVNICAKDGKISTNYNNINNDGGGKRLAEDVKTLVYDIEKYCNEVKLQYEDKV